MADDLLEYFFLDPSQRRDRQLEREISSARAEMANLSRMRRRETERLRSQLQEVTGSLESRLNRLQRMFSAYVELNELKDELATTYTDSSAQRREALGILSRLSTGQPVQPMQPDERYWLPDAVNAVLAVVNGGRDPQSEARATFLDQRADEFIVLAATSLGRGSAVADRLPEVLTSDGVFSASQRLLFRAALADSLGPVLPSLREVIAPTLSADGWQEWVDSRAAVSSSRGLAWLEVLTRPLADRVQTSLPGADSYISAARASLLPRSTKPAAARRDPLPAPDEQPAAAAPQARPDESAAAQALREMTVALVEEGLAEEQELLRRLRIAKRQLADPDGPADDPGLGDRVDVTEEVRQALLTEGLPGASRAELLTWVAPHLRATIEGSVVEGNASASQVRARVLGTTVAVSAQGYDRSLLTRGAAQQQAQLQRARRNVWFWGAASGMLAAAAVALGILGHQGLATLVLVGAGLGGLATLRAWSALRAVRSQQAADLERARRELDQAVARAAAADREQAVRRGEEAAVMDLLQQRLRD